MYIYPSFFAFLFYKIEKIIILGVLKCKGVSKVHEWCLFYTDL